VIHLNRHHQRMNHIHKVNQNNRGHAETRAAHTILMLVVTFVSSYTLNCISISFHISFVESCLWLRYVTKLLALSFPTISPLLLIFRDCKGHCSLRIMSVWKSIWQGEPLQRDSKVKTCPNPEKNLILIPAEGLILPCSRTASYRYTQSQSIPQLCHPVIVM
jgi:hypothetical protein